MRTAAIRSSNFCCSAASWAVRFTNRAVASGYPGQVTVSLKGANLVGAMADSFL